MVMKSVIALVAVGAVFMTSPNAAFARDGFSGGGGFQGALRSGGFRTGGYGGRGVYAGSGYRKRGFQSAGHQFGEWGRGTALRHGYQYREEYRRPAAGYPSHSNLWASASVGYRSAPYVTEIGYGGYAGSYGYQAYTAPVSIGYYASPVCIYDFNCVCD
jgi:hypothetical protein